MNDLFHSLMDTAKEGSR